jgi:dTDP-4-dehydrorhamnose reductase
VGRVSILIMGGSGFLGTELVRQAAAAGLDTAATYRSRPGDGTAATWHEVDLRAPERVAESLTEIAPDVVINATSGLADWAVTADGSVHVALAAARLGIRLVHVSSDAVFSGRDVHYDETSPPDPVTPYGAAKAAAETAVRLLVPGAVVARTSLIIGHGRSTHERLVHSLAEGAPGALFTDDVRCPVAVEDLAAALLEVATCDVTGTVHLAGPDAVSRHDLGVLIAHRDGLDASRLPTARRADTSPPGALDVRLDSRATQHRLRTRLRGAREFLRT